MRFEPNPTQALMLWKMITGASASEREPMLSTVKPARHRNALIEQGFLSKRKRAGSRAEFLVVEDPGWEWASHASEVKFNDAPTASRALQGLVRRLIPFLEQNDLALAALFRDEAGAPDEAPAAPIAPAATAAPDAPDSIGARVEQACLSLSGGTKKSRVRLSALRNALPAISRQQLDTALIEMQREHRLVLYREDNTPSLTAEDHAAALLVGDSPRHLVYLEA